MRRYGGVVWCPRHPVGILGQGAPPVARRTVIATMAAVVPLALSGRVLTAAPQAAAADWTRCTEGATDRQ